MTHLFPTVASEYRVALNASFYTATIAATTTLGTAVVNFTILMNNTYFQTPQAVISHLVGSSSDKTSFFTLETGKEVDTEIFVDPDSYMATSVIELSKSIIYSEIAAAGVYQFKLEVTVVARQSSGVTPLQETRSSLVNISVDGEYICQHVGYKCNTTCFSVYVFL